MIPIFIYIIKYDENNLGYCHRVIFQECEQHWAEIKTGMYWFGRKPALAAVLRSGAVTAHSLLQFFDAFVSTTSAKRCKFSSQFYGKGQRYVKSVVESGQPVVEIIADPSLFRRAHSLLPVPDFSPV